MPTLLVLVIGDKVEIINQNDDWSIVQLLKEKILLQGNLWPSKRRHIMPLM